MKKIRFSSIIALLLIFSLLLSSCGIFGIPDNNTKEPDDKDDNVNTECSHESTSLQGAKAATCAEEGYTGDVVCNDCTAIVTAGTVIPKTAHTFDSGKITKNPTCMETGVTTYTCTGCGTTQTSTIETVDHNDQYHDAQDGTHFHTCTNCYLNENKEHNPTDEGIFVPASCEEPAYTQYICADCNGVYKVYDESKPATGHSFSDWNTISEATCVSDGVKIQTCLNGCGEENVLTIPASEIHNYIFDSYESTPNCTDSGLAIYYCDDCGDLYNKELPKNGVHSYQPLENTGDGWVRKECEHCGDVISSFDASTLKEANVTTESIDTEASLEMNMESAAIQFPQDVVGQITSGSNLSVSAGVLDESAKEDAINNVENEEDKAALENAPIYDFTVKVDDTVFSDTFSTKVAITISYDNGDGDEEGIVIYYLAENGEIEKITDVVYNAQTKEVTFFVEHFSFYAVAYKETQAMRCKRGNHSYQTTNVTVPATCFSFGYTIYECVGCHRTTFDDLTERQDHSYGDLIDAKPTCEYGDYVTRVCENEGCGHVLNVKFYGATGHVMNHPATCDTPSTCTKCGKVLARAIGHEWTAWETVVQATAITNGLRRRYCTVCGKVDEVVIASTGEIEAISYDSYIELFNEMFGEVLGITGGVIELEFFINDREISAKLNVMQTENGYRINMVANATMYDTYPKVYDTETVEFYYDNGVWVGMNEDGAGSDLSDLIPMPIEVFKVVAEDLHSQIDEYAKLYRDQMKELIDHYIEIAGDEIDGIFADAELPYTVSQLHDVLASIETVYAYLSLKLGYTTMLEMGAPVTLPTAEDWDNVLGAFMSATVENGITTYTLTEAPIFDAINEVLGFVEAHLNDTVAYFIYFVIGEELVKLDASIIDFDALISYLKTNLPGTLTLFDAVDMFIEATEGSNTSIEDIYSLINQYAAANGESDFDAEAWVNENGNLTLDQLVQAMFDSEEATAEALYDMIAEELNTTKMAEVVIRGAAIRDLYDYARNFLEMIDFSANVSISIDDSGRITAISIDDDFWAQTEPDIYEKLQGFKATIKHDESVKVEIPEDFKSVMTDVSSYYDDKGNLVICGLDKNVNYEFEILGGSEFDFASILVKDETLSREYGYNVYVLPREYWAETNHIGTYYLIDGKYYSNNVFSNLRYARANETVALDDLLANPKNYFSVNENNNWGYLSGYDNVPVYPIRSNLQTVSYSSSIGIAYCIDGTWMASTDYGRVQESYMIPGNEEGREYYYVNSAVTLDEFYSTIQISSIMDYNSNDFYYRYNTYVEVDGTYYKAQTANMQFGKTGNSSSYLAVTVNGKTVLINDYDGWYHKTLYTEAEEEQLPEHDYSYEYNTKLFTLDANGNLTEINVRYVSVSVLVPTYYVRVTDTVYNRLNYGYYSFGYSGESEETMKLSDGNTLHVMGRTTDNDYGYQYGYTTVYGYAETEEGLYFQCAVIMNGDEVKEIKYRETQSAYYLSYEYMYDIDDYLSSDANGNYVVKAELINNLKSYTTEPGAYFAINVNAEVRVGNGDIEIMYNFGAYMVPMSVSLTSPGSTNNHDFWYPLFNGSGSGHPSNQYNVVKNDDGSISLVFNNGTTIDDLDVYAVSIPVEDKLVKDTVKSNEVGLDIYRHDDTYMSNHHRSYVYQNGKYYNYYTNTIYDFIYYEENPLDNWYISSMYYRFNMIGAEGMPDDIPVYETCVSFKSLGNNYNDPYDWINTYSIGSLWLYTFYIDGVLNVAVEAEVTGESLLKFESYMPLDEYMESLEVEYEDESYYYNSYLLADGTRAYVYRTNVYFYETDGSGNRLSDSSKHSVSLRHLVKDGVKKYVSAYVSIGEKMIVQEVADLSEVPANAERSEWVNVYVNGNFTIASYNWEAENSRTRYFIKLAGRMYFYSDSYYWYEYSYQNQKIDEWQFNNTATDKAWVYRLETVNDEGYIEYYYYSEFIPSDTGFTPSGEMVDPSIIGDVYNETLLGYTASGEPLYEVAYWVTGDESPYTREEQADGTVFLHKNGVGYLEITEKYGKYYVRARKVTAQDGSTEIYCFLRGAVIDADEIQGDLMDSYVSVTDNKVTFTKEFLDAAASSNKNEMSIHFYLSGYGYMYLNYYTLESLFMMAE